MIHTDSPAGRAFVAIGADGDQGVPEGPRRIAARLHGREHPSRPGRLVYAFDDDMYAVLCAASCQRTGAHPGAESAAPPFCIGAAGTPALAEALMTHAAQAGDGGALLSDALVAAVAPRLVGEFGFEPQDMRTLAGTPCRPYRLITDPLPTVFRYRPWSTPRRRAIALTIGLLIIATAWIGLALTT